VIDRWLPPVARRDRVARPWRDYWRARRNASRRLPALGRRTDAEQPSHTPADNERIDRASVHRCRVHAREWARWLRKRMPAGRSGTFPRSHLRLGCRSACPQAPSEALEKPGFVADPARTSYTTGVSDKPGQGGIVQKNIQPNQVHNEQREDPGNSVQRAGSGLGSWLGDRSGRELKRLGDQTGVLLTRGVMEVLHRGLDVAVAHPLLDPADVGLADHPRSECVA